MEWLIETHVHADHLSAAPNNQARLGGKIGIGEGIKVVQDILGKVFNEGTEFQRDGSQFDRLFGDGDSYRIGGMTAHAMHTPGRTPARMTHVVGDAAFVGDSCSCPTAGRRGPISPAAMPGRSTVLMAAVIVTIMLVPQSLAYAMLAGLPPDAGHSAAILPLVAYAVFGASRTLVVGTVAVISVMTATAVGQVAGAGAADRTTAAMTLAFMSGLVMLAVAALRLGFIANFLSHPVIGGFISASGMLIAVSQLRHILGIGAEGGTLPELVQGLAALAVPALLISLGGLAESVSVGQTPGARRRQWIAPNQELTALAAANLSAALTGVFPMTGGFVRSVVNFDAGAVTPMAGVFTAPGILLVTLTLTPVFRFLPQAVLAATIIAAVLGLVDLAAFRWTWAYSRADFAAMAATAMLVLLAGVEAGILAGVALSILLFPWRNSRPHYAVAGRVRGTEHFRNVQRQAVETDPAVLTLRVDESLYLANARFLEDMIPVEVADRPAVRHLVLMCPAVNLIDASALESLAVIADRLDSAGEGFTCPR